MLFWMVIPIFQVRGEYTYILYFSWHSFKFNLGEAVISAQCKTAVSIFSIDYDAPVFVAAPIQAHLKSALRKTGRQILWKIFQDLCINYILNYYLALRWSAGTLELDYFTITAP